MKSNKKKEKIDKSELFKIIAAFGAVFVVAIIYIYVFYLYCNIAFKDSFHYQSAISMAVFAVTFILSLVFIPLSVCFIFEKINWLVKITTPITIILILLPYIFISTGTSFDANSIKKYSFGKVKQEYQYSEIESCQMHFTLGSGTNLGYRIVFENGEKMKVSHSGHLFDVSFKNDTANLVEFNKIVSKNCEVTLYENSDELMESYFDSKADYKYFKRFIKNSTN